MNLDDVLSFLRSQIEREQGGAPVLPTGYLEQVIEKSPFAPLLDSDQRELLKKRLEVLFGTSQDDGHSLRTEFVEWYDQAKPEIDFHYWKRLRKYWLDKSILPVKVVESTDRVTDEILGFLGNPADDSTWRRRGLVMGHVQSGKTTNYSALVAKAADAGYRFIVVLAGLTNSLRYQTQERLDMAFVGKASSGDRFTSKIYPVARMLVGMPGESAPPRHPFCATTTSTDFNLEKVKGFTASEGNFADPVLFVTKKNQAVLQRLNEWLRSFRHGQPLDGPLLVIDDESDNASVNTAKDSDDVTKINERIRELLATSRRSAYVGYTATPFANIFIDPDTEDDMLKEDLFPRDFIKSLSPPDNYIGAKVLFSETGQLRDVCVRVIPESDQTLIPLNHKSTFIVDELPPSLVDALREFILFRAIRILAGEGDRHSSMLVNVSRFNNVQAQIKEHLYRELTEIGDAVDAWAASDHWEKSDVLQELHRVWSNEYLGQVDLAWEAIRGVLKKVTSSMTTALVNMRAGGLVYPQSGGTGLHVVAIGGLALARGLTLEGLAVSYVLRNASASDTLMQMGRWFGYRPNYEHLCRIHATENMLDQFEDVSESVEELRADLVRMERLGKTPNEFGLKVRRSPVGIAITAANKMRTAAPVTLAFDLRGRHLQGYSIYNDSAVNARNRDAAQTLVSRMVESGCTQIQEPLAHVWTDVPVRHVLELLRTMELARTEFQHGEHEASPVVDYITDRMQTELSHWCVAIPFRNSTSERKLDRELLTLPFEGIDSKPCRTRHSAILADPLGRDTRVIKITRKNVVANPGAEDLKYGEDELDKKRDHRKELEKEISDERATLESRSSPVLIIHAVDLKLAGDANRWVDEDKMPAVTISIGFPDTDLEPRPRSYAATRRFMELLAALNDTPDPDEESLADVVDDE